MYESRSLTGAVSAAKAGKATRQMSRQASHSRRGGVDLFVMCMREVIESITRSYLVYPGGAFPPDCIPPDCISARRSTRLLCERLLQPCDHVRLPVRHRWVFLPAHHSMAPAFHCDHLAPCARFPHGIAHFGRLLIRYLLISIAVNEKERRHTFRDQRG